MDFCPYELRSVSEDLPDFLRPIYYSLHKQKILGSYGPRFTFPDEPQFPQYACKRPAGKNRKLQAFGYGCSENYQEAITISVMEAIEHYCILYEQNNSFIRDSYDHFLDSAVDPARFIPFSKEQLSKSEYGQFRLEQGTKINWLEGYSLTKKKNVLVPASVVYAHYNHQKWREPIIQLTNSTGAACGQTRDFAIYRGICEVIERDAYMISFLNGIPKPIIAVEDNPELLLFKQRIERYNLKVYFLLTRLDCRIPTTTCLLFDRTGSGPAVCTGLGANLDVVHAIKTAGLEAVRRHVSARDRFFRTKPLPEPKQYSFDWFLMEKQRLWSSPHMIQIASKFLSDKTIKSNSIQSEPSMSDGEKVASLVNELALLGNEVIVVDVTVPAVKREGLHVMKVLIPEMVPLWRDERYPYLGIKRLYDVPKKMGYLGSFDLNQKNCFSIHPF